MELAGTVGGTRYGVLVVVAFVVGVYLLRARVALRRARRGDFVASNTRRSRAPELSGRAAELLDEPAGGDPP